MVADEIIARADGEMGLKAQSHKAAAKKAESGAVTGEAKVPFFASA
jgi:hypothetical protein